MDWAMVGALGEIMGALGVIITLGYLARQIRFTKISAESRMLSDLLDQNTVLLAQLSSDDTTAGLWRRGMAGDPDLSVDELVRFRFLIYQLVVVWERLCYMSLSHKAEPWIFEHLANVQREASG